MDLTHGDIYKLVLLDLFEGVNIGVRAWSIMLLIWLGALGYNLYFIGEGSLLLCLVSKPVRIRQESLISLTGSWMSDFI